MDQCKELGIDRFILMSANGVRPDGTGYQKTKWLAEQYLMNTDLKWTIFRPSLIFGDPRGSNRPEFCTQLKKDLIRLPIPAPLFHDGIVPVCRKIFHVPDPCKGCCFHFVGSLAVKIPYQKYLSLADRTLWVGRRLSRLAKGLGKISGHSAPAIFIRALAVFFTGSAGFP
ncbi:MAG: hypothetical protein Ct9H300mP9_6540 [Candidatus Neomarinimicrobiota bacterium]|nr:MAG: hypothetical protein Ct9H300mP9_6540 [Candidatus Neomarinimicrobiota bacterium]